MPVGSDGKVHTTFTHNPSNLRLSSVGPNLQNIPRGDDSVVQKWVKDIFVAPVGERFWALDFKGIEAVLVGYFCGSKDYYRLARIGVHAFFTSHVVGRPVDLSWSDNDLARYFGELKKEEPQKYNICKRCVHLSNYMGKPHRMFMEYPETFHTVKDAKYYQDLYFDLFPEIRKWHKTLCQQVDATRHERSATQESLPGITTGVAHAINPFGYLHRFYRVLQWTKIDDQWFSTFGDDAKRLIAFGPSSSASGILKEAGMTLFYDHFDLVGHTLRLFIHDEIFGQASVGSIEAILACAKKVMEKEQPRFPLPPHWKMGEFLSVHTEATVGQSWGSMETVEV